jgi:GPH family glycoside/pentoside/hexuronide:cation symporter
LGWGLGTLAIGILFNTTGMLLLRYLTDYVGLAAGLAGLLIAISKVYDAVTDPLMGWVSDNTRSRLGRRRPWLLVGTLLCGLALVALFNVPSALSGTLLVAWVVGVLLFYATAYTVFTVPYLAMPAEMTTDYHERSRLIAFRVAFIGAAQLVAGYAAPMLILAFGDGRRGHSLMSLVLAAALVACGLACFLMTGAARATVATAPAGAPPATGPALAPAAAARVGFGEQLRAVAGNRPFLILILSKLALLLAIAIFGATFAYFVVHVLKATYALLGTFTVVSTVTMFASLPLWLRLIKRTDKRRTFMLAALAYALLSLSWLLSGQQEATIWVLARAGGMGVLGCGTLLAGQALLPDAIEYDYLRHGARREALFAGFYSMAEKLASAIGLALTGGFLGAMGYLSSTGGALVRQPDSALLGISLAVGLVPAAMLTASCVLIWFYDLTEQRLIALRSAVEGTDHEGATPR